MLRICLAFWKSEPQYAYKLHAYKKKTCICYKVPGRRIRSCYRVKARTVYGGRNCCSHAFSSAVAVLPPW